MFLFQKKKPEVTTLEESTLQTLGNGNRSPAPAPHEGGRINLGADLVENYLSTGTSSQPDLTQDARPPRTYTESPDSTSIYDRDELNFRRGSTLQPGAHPIKEIRGDSGWPDGDGEQRTQRRTVMCFVLVLAALGLALVMLLLVAEKSIKTCSTPECVVAAGEIISSMDRSADPCTEFPRFTCGGWQQEHPVPPGFPAWDRFSALRLNVHHTIAELLQAPMTKADNRAVNISKTFYAACMNKTAWERTGVAPLVELLDQFGGFPLADANWSGEGYDWVKVVAKARRLIYSSYLIDVDVTNDEKDSSKYAVHIGPGQLPTPYQYILSNETEVQQAELRRILAISAALSRREEGVPSDREITRKEEEIEEEVIDLIGIFRSGQYVQNGEYRDAGEDNATMSKLADAMNLFTFIYKITQATAKDANNPDLYAFYNPMTISELQKDTYKLPEAVKKKVDWISFLNDIFSDAGQDFGYADTVVVYSPEYLKTMHLLLDEAPTRVIANFIGYMISVDLSEEVTKMPESLSPTNDTEAQGRSAWPDKPGPGKPWPREGRPHKHHWPRTWRHPLGPGRPRHLSPSDSWRKGSKGFEGSGAPSSQRYFAGIPKQNSWMECSIKADNFVNPGATYLYVTRTVSSDQIHETREIAADLLTSLRQTIRGADWMDDSTQEAALEKLDNMHQLVGFDADLLNVTELDIFYKPLPDLSPTSHFGNFLTLLRHLSNYSLAILAEEPQKDAFTASAMMINAMYHRQHNAMLIPVGLLRPPFFRANTIAAVNYGAVGAVIGHEMMHGFDNMGRNVDAYGNLKEWWSEDASSRYQQKAQCYADQYNNMGVDGDNTLPENIADNAGLHVAHRAFRGRAAAALHPTALPGMADLSQDQLFFISYAQLWCTNYLPGALEHSLLTDVHTPGHMRVLAAMANSPRMRAAFKCPRPVNASCKLW